MTNQESIRSFLEIQDQLHTLQQSNDRLRREAETNRLDAEAAAARNTQLLETRMKAIESQINSEQLKTLTEARQQNKTMLTQAMIFAASGFLVLILAAVVHWLTVSRFTKLLVQLPAGMALGAGKTPAALGMGMGETAMLPMPAVEQSTERFLEILGRLEKRILDVEASAQSRAALPENGGGKAQLSGPSAGNTGEAADALALLLGKGQTLLKLDQAEEALACFDEVLAREPGHVEAWLKKGAALERLQRLNEAIDCYDRVIATDNSATMAYLYKGGVFNRLERYSEALECYEQALRTQEKGRAANVIID